MKDNTVPLKFVTGALMSLPFRVKDTACLSPSSYLMLNRYWVSWMAVV